VAIPRERKASEQGINVQVLKQELQISKVAAIGDI
jgi:hypothetical protein